MNKFKKAFTLIELLVVIAIIAILATLAVVALQNSRANARDAKRLADVKQMQTALELYFNDNNSYPTSITSTIATSGIIYMTSIPNPPALIDGDCTLENNNYSYSSDGSTYSISFCLGGKTGELTSGVKQATPSGISNPPAIPWSCGDALVDSRDLQQYPTVQIGSQCWMAKNLNYDDGCSLNSWVSYQDKRWCGCHNNDPNACATFGILYQWSAAMASSTAERSQGICPSGWHIPSSAEFASLSSYLGGDSVSGGKIRQAGTTTWTSPNSSATNESGFTALSVGSRSFDSGSFVNKYSFTYFWSSSVSGSDAVLRYLWYGNAQFVNYVSSKANGLSVRCLKD